MQIAVAEAMGAAVVELHTGAYCEAALAGDTDEQQRLLERLTEASAIAHGRGLEVHAGHGLTYDTVKPVAAIPEIAELNIGHFLIGEAIFRGLRESVETMRGLIAEARAEIQA